MEQTQLFSSNSNPKTSDKIEKITGSILNTVNTDTPSKLS